jgi:CDP-diacylglycerol--glycerol-3-phosphate 3-phosphatidyltransferase
MEANLSRMRYTVARRLTEPIIGLICKTGVGPNSLTITGLVINIGAATAIAMGHLIWGGSLILFSGAFDLLDGALARAKGQETAFGAVLDSTVDRMSEAVVLLGLLILCMGHDSTIEVLLVYIVFVGSVLVSYVRARAEGMGLKCEVGWFTRAERIVVLALGLFANQVLITLCILVGFTYLTAGQRLVYVWQQAGKRS